MKIAILGYSDQGKSAYEYWNTPGNTLTIHDSRTDIQLPVGVSAVLGDDYLRNLDQYDLIVRGAPTIHPKDIVGSNPEALDILEKVTTVTNEFMRVCPTRNVIGVTGTKGKGTTSSLIARMLEAAGNRVHLGGNIGIPPLEMLKNDIKPEDWVVLELANFQLIDIKYSPKIAVCLMVVPEHLNWHADMAEYIAAKQQLFRWQTAGDIAIYNPDSTNSQAVVSASPGTKLPYMQAPGARVEGDTITIGGQAICKTTDLRLRGKHNWQNACAATTAAWQALQDPAPIKATLTSFSGLEHRLEFVRGLNGVRYFDDSFGTTPETAMVAVEAFTEPKVLILGGSSKNADFAALAATIASNDVRHVFVMGNTTNTQHPTEAAKIAAALSAASYTDYTVLAQPGGNKMQDVVAAAQAIAQTGDVVLLSAACASFDMFTSYKDRAEQFVTAVQAL